MVNVKFNGLSHGGEYVGSDLGQSYPWPVGQVREFADDKAAHAKVLDWKGCGPSGSDAFSVVDAKAAAAAKAAAEAEAKANPTP